jgi:hypothetical protein
MNYVVLLCESFSRKEPAWNGCTCNVGQRLFRLIINPDGDFFRVIWACTVDYTAPQIEFGGGMLRIWLLTILKFSR